MGRSAHAAFAVGLASLVAAMAPLTASAAPATAPSTGTSAPLASWATATVPLMTMGLTYDATRDVLLATTPSWEPSLGNSLVELDPETGALGRYVHVGSEPGQVVVTDDGTRAFVALSGASAITEVNLATFTVARTIALGQAPNGAPYVVEDLTAMPGRSDIVVAAVRRIGGGTYAGAVYAYEAGERLPVGLTMTRPPDHIEALTGDRLFGYQSSTSVFANHAIQLDEDGLTSTTGARAITGFTTRVEAAAGRIYSSTGLIVDQDTFAVLGSFSGQVTEVSTDGILTTVDILGDVVARFDAATGEPLGSRTFDIASGSELVATSSGFAVGGAGPVLLLGPAVSGPAFVAPPAQASTTGDLHAVNVSVQPHDAVYDQARDLLYVSVASTSPSEADHLLALDPSTGEVVHRLLLGSDPGPMAMAEDGSLLHVGLTTTGSIATVDLATFASTGSFALGVGTPMLAAEDIAVRPGTADELLVSLDRQGITPGHGGVALYVDGVRMPSSTPVDAGANLIVPLDASTAYGYSTGDLPTLYHLGVSGQGVEVLQEDDRVMAPDARTLLLHDGLLYADQARVVDPTGPEMVATLPSTGAVAIDDVRDRIYLLEPVSDHLIELDQDTHRQVARREGLAIPGASVDLLATGTDSALRFAIVSTSAVVLLVPPLPGQFHAVAPSRLADTRTGSGVRAGRVPAGGTIAVDVTGRGGVPSTGVDAVVVNLTSAASTTASYLTAWATGQPKPSTSNLNFRAGQVAANQAIVPVGDDGTITIANSAGATHVVVDVQGWFGDGSEDGGSSLHPLPPARVGDSRSGSGLPIGRIGPGQAVDLEVAGLHGVPEHGAAAVVVNVTAVGATSQTHLTLWASGGAKPSTSNVNVAAGQVVANQAIVPVSANGRIRIANNAGATHVIIDVQGWFGAYGSLLHPVAPTRVADSRTGVGLPTGKLPAGVTRTVDVTGVAGVPQEGVVAVVVNLTVTGATAASHLTAWPTGQAKPGTSNVNFGVGQVVANQAIVPVGPDGTISIANAFGATHVVVDVQGWFGPAG